MPTATNQSPKIDETAFERKDLMTDHMIPVAVAGRAQESGCRLDGAQQVQIRYFAYESSSLLGVVDEQIVGSKPSYVKTIYLDGLVEAIKHRLVAGIGFAWMPEKVIHREFADGTVVPICNDAWRTQISIVAYSNTS